MRKLNVIFIIIFLLISLAGCEQNKRSEGTANDLRTDTTASRSIQSGTQYKITFNNDQIAPDTIRMTSGVCYQFDFENNGNSDIEFIAGKDPSEKGFSKNFFEGMSVENLINNKEIESKNTQPLTGIKLKPGEKGSLAFTPDDDKKGEWLLAAKAGSASGKQRSVIIVE